MNPQRLAKPFLLALLLSVPLGAGAQEMPAPALTGPILGPFAAMRVAIVPVQLWRADTSAWSMAVTWAVSRLALDSAIAGELQERGLGRRWAYASDVVRSARRNPTYATDPYALGVGRWRAMPPKIGDDNKCSRLRSFADCAVSDSFPEKTIKTTHRARRDPVKMSATAHDLSSSKLAATIKRSHSRGNAALTSA